MEFADRDSVKVWIIRNQLGRRNLKEWDRFDLTKSLEEIEAKKAKERQGTRTDLDIVEKFPQSKTRDVMGAMVGVSGKTYDHTNRLKLSHMDNRQPEAGADLALQRYF